MVRDTEPGRDALLSQFTQAVAALAEGELTFPAPFDVASSAALADNIDFGDIADRLFDVTALRDCGFRVSISAFSPDHPDLPDREVIKTEVASTRLLFALLDALMDELDPQKES